MGDGAFAKGNKPFKNTIAALLGKEVTIRWDLLHLINCAHKEARGKAKYDQDEVVEHTTDSDDDDMEDDVNQREMSSLVSELIDYIQVTWGHA